MAWLRRPACSSVMTRPTERETRRDKFFRDACAISKRFGGRRPDAYSHDPRYALVHHAGHLVRNARRPAGDQPRHVKVASYLPNKNGPERADRWGPLCAEDNGGLWCWLRGTHFSSSLSTSGVWFIGAIDSITIELSVTMFIASAAASSASSASISNETITGTSPSLALLVQQRVLLLRWHPITDHDGLALHVDRADAQLKALEIHYLDLLVLRRLLQDFDQIAD